LNIEQKNTAKQPGCAVFARVYVAASYVASLLTSSACKPFGPC
jgi:hypothetical protein